MKVIVALGNPGEEYRYTRHNLGFLLLDRFHSSKGCSPFVSFKGSLLSFNNYLNNNQYILCKPFEFMNNSGLVLFEVLRSLRLSPQAVLLVYDELDISIGRYKLSRKKSVKVAHRGVWDVESKYPFESILKLKVGIGPEGNRNVVIREFVMERFTQEELECISSLEGEIFSLLERFISLSEREIGDPINYLSRVVR